MACELRGQGRLRRPGVSGPPLTRADPNLQVFSGEENLNTALGRYKA